MIRARSFIAQDAPFSIGLWADAGTADIPSTVGAVSTSGFSQAGIGGAVYRRAQALPPFNGGFQSADGAFWEIVSGQGLLITQFGAIGDSNLSFTLGADLLDQSYPFVPVVGTDNSPFINAAINYANSLPGGGTVLIPATGVFGCLEYIDPDLGTAGAIWVKSGVSLITLGGWIARLSQTDPLAGVFHLIRIDNRDKVRISVNADGNRAGQLVHTSAHIIRSHNSSNVSIVENWLYNTQGYTISSDVDIDAIVVSRNHIFNSSADAIDFHNTGVENNVAHVDENVINGFGYNGVPKAGIHGRGQGFKCRGNSVRNCGPIINGIAGIAVGNGENIAGQEVANNYVEMGTACTNAKGIVTNNPNSVCANNTVAGDTGTLSGYAINGMGTSVTGNVLTVASGKTVSVVRDGFLFGITAIGCTITGNVADACGDDAFNDLGSNNTYSNNSGTNCGGYAFNMLSSTGALLDSLNTESNCTSGLLRRGTGTKLDQSTDEDDTPTFPTVLIRDVPVGATDAVNKSYFDSAIAGAFTVFQTGLASDAITGDTSEHVFHVTGLGDVLKTIAGSALGLNGRIRIELQGINNNSAGSKTWRVRLGGLTGTTFLAVSNTTNINRRDFCSIANQNSLALQKGWVSNNGAYGTSGSTSLSGAVDTSVDQDLVITGQLSNGADTMTLDAFSMQFFPA